MSKDPSKKLIKALTREASFRADSYDKKSNTVDMLWTTGERVLRNSIWDGPFYEELEVSNDAVDLTRLNSGAPLLKNHDSSSLDSVMGVVERAWIDGNNGMATVRMSDRADVQPLANDIRSGIIRNVSVGYRINAMEKVGEVDGVPVMRATRWQPFEVSAVPVGADSKAGFRAEEELNECVITGGLRMEDPKAPEAEAAPEAPKEEAKPAEAAPAAEAPAAPAAPSAEEVRKLVKTEERKRIQEIVEICQTAKLSEEQTRNFLTGDASIDQIRKDVINMIATEKTTPSVPRIEAGNLDETQTRREGMEEVISNRLGITKEISDKGRKYVGLSLIEMARKLTGLEYGSRADVASRALSTSDFPNILANVADKQLMQAYKLQPQTFNDFVSKSTLADYKPAYRYQVGDAPSMDQLEEGGEYKFGTFGEKVESIQLKDYGKMLRFTRQMLINDDLSAFQRVIKNFGSSASRLESKLVYDILTSNPNMGDGNPLFHASHGNLGAAATITAGLQAAEKAIMDQQTLDGLDYLNLTAKYLIVGTAKKIEAQQMLTGIQPNISTSVNPFSNAYQLIVEPRISSNNWYLACPPSDIDTIEVSYLEGEQGPVIESKEGWNSDGMEVKIRHTVAVKALEWKGLFKNPGL